MKNKNRIKRAKEKHKRPFSIAFIIAIPGNFILASIALISFVSLMQNYILDEEIWAIFLTSFIGAVAIVGSSKIQTFRTFIHELKHAVVVIFTGNNLKNFVVEKETGHVEFEMYKDKLRFAPIIALAPYFFPLFSLPALIVCLVMENNSDLLLAALLGITLAVDISMAYTDLHPHQSDLKKVTGGFFASLLYLASAHFLWIMICLLWVVGGRNAFVYTGYVIMQFAKILAAKIASKH